MKAKAVSWLRRLVCFFQGHDCGPSGPPGWSAQECRMCHRTVPVYRPDKENQ